ncbi:DUF1758 domain-containing protein [Trichonephila inaurata madagascariensis]|uniref:DUF1758 domain-containing protein n=1 Tax=Trichonephila inaurata madagascariensis TaxID=2747483 RepID=A0A8X7CGS4_9ARAC|nr:DUF1758 domain-containing protein [Trichonephila inaurata madagascariensis]
MHNDLLRETKTPLPKEEIVSTLGSEKVLQPSSEELTVEPDSRAIALASAKRGVSWGSEKGLLPTAVNGHQERLKLRKPCGRYSVSLPFKENIQENVNLGDFRSIASKRLDLDRDPKLNNLYTKFIEEYLSLDHMEEITNIDDITSEEGFFLPHHGVLRAGNRSRPLRMVLNGLQKTDLDISLNDVLCKGGVIQDDLFSIMLRARKHAYFFSCDLSHMFRQIQIHPHQRHFQKFLWKKGLNEPVQIFKLKTVTHRTTPACYLSTRVLKQLSLDERENFPKAADIVLHDVYLDDILGGCSSLNEL